MKLAEALAQRADMQRRLAQVKLRAISNSRMQEGEEPAEDPRQLIAEYDRIAGELAALVRRINRTNLATELRPGMTVTDAIAERDALALRRSMATDLASAASARMDRSTRSEVKYVTVLDVPALRTAADNLAREYRELDTAIQERNWSTDLLE